MPPTALVIGSGPNGLSAAIVLAEAGYQVEVREASSHFGGGASSAELTIPGFLHDFGSAVHPMALASPFFSSLPLGVEWVQPPIPFAHPLDDGTAVLLHRDLGQTAAGLGEDGSAWRNLFDPLVRDWEIFRHELLAPLGWTNHPVRMARFGINAVLPASTLLNRKFTGPRAKALFCGVAAHYAFLEQPFSASIGMVLGAAGHAVGWPIPRGGSQRITNALLRHFQNAGGAAHTNAPVNSITGEHDLVLADTSPRSLARIAGEKLPQSFRTKLERYRYGPGSFKVDWALNNPIPWRAAECLQAGTVHVGGTADEILASERAAVTGKHSDRPYILLSQPTLFDPSRAPTGKHIAWAYCHVPNGSNVDMTDRIEAQIERFAPGFRDTILARSVSSPGTLQQADANLVGGDVTGGMNDFRQLLLRPTWRRYATPNPKIWLCSAATPPGAGVHGMCGYHAARKALGL